MATSFDQFAPELNIVTPDCGNEEMFASLLEHGYLIISCLLYTSDAADE